MCSATLDDLIALRKLRRPTGGIELDRLNAGERRRRAEGAGGEGADKLNEDGTVEGTQGGLLAANVSKDRVKDQE